MSLDHRRGRVGLLLVLVLLLLPGGYAPSAAQGDPPLVGPLLAANLPHNNGIALYDLGTGAVRELRFSDGRHWLGSFSPDGCHITFTMNAGGVGGMRIYRANLDGSDLRPLITAFSDDTGALAWEAWSPLWSPAGDRIAFVMLRDYLTGGERTRSAHIAWVPAAGGIPAFYSVTGREGQPVWSPDGQWLAYLSFEEFGLRARGSDIWVVSADGATKYPLTDFPEGGAIFPRWSPDGGTIGFVYAPTGNNHQFWSVPAAGGEVRQWSGTQTLVLNYDWLPDGSGLVASILGWAGTQDNLLWRVPVPGWADTDATPYLPDPEATATDYPRFSPDGRYLAFRSAYAAMLYDTASGDLRQLYELGLNNSPLVWGPAGFAGEAACTPSN